MRSDADSIAVVEIWIAKSRAVMRDVLARRVQCDPAALHIELGVKGKPHLPGHPSLHFNLSHSGDLFALAITEAGPVGIDIEHRREPKMEAAVRRRVNLGGGEFFDEWTRREAYTKALGTGIAAISQIPDESWSLVPFVPAPGYTGAIAIQLPRVEIIMREWPSELPIQIA